MQATWSAWEQQSTVSGRKKEHHPDLTASRFAQFPRGHGHGHHMGIWERKETGKGPSNNGRTSGRVSPPQRARPTSLVPSTFLWGGAQAFSCFHRAFPVF
jgi:hypothetical protein